MKNYRKNIFGLAFALAGMMTIVSCSDDTSDGTTSSSVTEFSGLTPQTDIQVIDSATVTLHDHFTKLLAETQGANDGEDAMLAEYAKQQLHAVDSIDAAEADQGANGYGDVKSAKLSYKWVSIKYQSVDKDSKPVTLSTLIAFPKSAIAKNLVIGCHCTIAADNQRPSNYDNLSLTTDVGQMVLHAHGYWIFSKIRHDNLVVIPDYEGYGETRSHAHPYLYQELTARQVIDGAKAGMEWYEKNVHKMNSGWGTMSVGYSQGGSVAMAVQRYIEKKNLSKDFNFMGSCCGDGPYDPIATLKTYVNDDKAYMPVALGLIVKGMCDANPIMTKAKYQPSDFFSDKFMASGIIELINSKNYNTDEIQEKLADASLKGTSLTAYVKIYGKDRYEAYTPENCQKGYVWTEVTENEAAYWKTSEIMRPEILEYFKTGTTSTAYLEKAKALEAALEMNNLTTNWTPAHPMVVFHSTKDEVVPFSNYTSALNTFGSPWFKGMKYVNDETYTHVASGSVFYVKYEGGFSDKILNSKTDWNKVPTETVLTGGLFW